jgi:putative PIN family toxin of toxin-antitoxin system
MRQTKFQVVIDTNVWISGIIFGGKPEKVIKFFVDGTLVAVTSEELLSELRRKITQKFPLYAPHLAALEASIRERAMLVQLGTQPVDVSRDPDDNLVIETALIGHASHIVTGDKDLLVLREYQNIQIMKPDELLQLVSQS